MRVPFVSTHYTDERLAETQILILGLIGLVLIFLILETRQKKVFL